MRLQHVSVAASPEGAAEARAFYGGLLGLDAIWARIQELAARLRAALAAVDGVTLLDRGRVLGATVTFDVAGREPEEVKRFLAERRVNVSVMDRLSAQLDFGARGIESAVRSAVHYYNDDSDLERLVDGVRALV